MTGTSASTSALCPMMGGGLSNALPPSSSSGGQEDSTGPNMMDF